MHTGETSVGAQKVQMYFQELTPEIYSSPWGPLSRQLSCWWNQVRSSGWSCCKDMLVSWLPSGHSLTLSSTWKYQCLFPRWRCFPLDSPSVWTSARRRACVGPVEMLPQWLQEAHLGHSCLLVYRQVGVEAQMWRHLQEAVKIHSVQSLSCVWFCDPKECRTTDFPVYHQLPELTQTHVHRVGDAIQPSLSLLFPSPPAFNLSQHQSLFIWVCSSHHVAKVLAFQLQHQSF